jgi:DNA-directed RNA polymerase specialized sigma24 family protein
MHPWASEDHLRDLEDAELTRLAQAGDAQAFNELFFRHRAKALGYAKQLAQDPHLAEDIVQEALINAFLHLGKLSQSSDYRQDKLKFMLI